MILTEPEINPNVARQIIENARLKGVTVEVYLKEISKRDYPKVKVTNDRVDLSLSQKWLDENQHNYVGKWIVLDGDKLIGYGDNPLPIVEKARSMGVKIPFVKRIEDTSEPFMGGWL
jgi:hypothetical protein